MLMCWSALRKASVILRSHTGHVTSPPLEQAASEAPATHMVSMMLPTLCWYARLCRQFLVWNMSYRFPTSCQHSHLRLVESNRLRVKMQTRRSRHLVSGADVLLPFHVTHPGELEEAAVVEVVLDAQVVAVSEGRGARARESTHTRADLSPTWQSSPTCPRRCRFFCSPRFRKGRTCLRCDLYTATVEARMNHNLLTVENEQEDTQKNRSRAKELQLNVIKGNGGLRPSGRWLRRRPAVQRSAP